MPLRAVRCRSKSMAFGRRPNAEPYANMDLSWILNHLGEDREQYFGAVAPPIVQSSIFAFPTVAKMREGFRDELFADGFDGA